MRKTIYLIEPEDAGFFSHGAEKMQKRKEHFEPIIKQTRAICVALGVSVLNTNGSGLYTGELEIEYTEEEQLATLNSSLNTERLQHPDMPLLPYETIRCSGNTVTCPVSNAVVATRWKGGLDSIFPAESQRRNLIECIQKCTDCHTLLQQGRDEEDTFKDGRDGRLDSALL